MGSGLGGDWFRDRKRWVQGYEEIGSGISRDVFKIRRRMVHGIEREDIRNNII